MAFRMKKGQTIMSNLNLNRENWLNNAAGIFINDLFNNHIEGTFPPFHMSIGNPTPSNDTKVLGVCHNKASSEDGVNQVFISPRLSNAGLTVLNVLVHEMVHVENDCIDGHKGGFARLARSIGLEGKLTSTTLGGEALQVAEDILEVLGPIPHAKLTSAKKTQKNRNLKATCSTCETIFRASKTALSQIDNTSHCPFCAAVGNIVIE